MNSSRGDRIGKDIPRYRGRRKRRPYRLAFMRLFKTAISILLVYLFAGVFATAHASDSITVSVDQTRNYFPGDLIELEVVVRSSEYGRYEIREPSNELLRYRGTQEFPVRKVSNGQYEQRWVVLYQISRSGEIAITGGEMRSKSEGDGPSLSLEKVVIQSGGFGSEQDPNRPETLTSLQAASSNRSWALFSFGLFVIVCLFGFGWWRTRQKANRTERVETSPVRTAVEGILAKWNSGEVPARDLERFLHEYHSACPPSLVELIEQVLYSQNGQPSELESRLRREFVS